MTRNTKIKRCIILIDGSNFYFKLKNLHLHSLLNFDFLGFTKMLAGEDSVVSTTYFVGAVRTDGTKKTQGLFNQQRMLLNYLKKNNILYSLGYLLKTDGKLHEKGVDVQIAVDILVAAYENTADKIILVSSDTDLIPAIIQAQKKGKLIEYIGFTHQPSIAMERQCSKFRLLKKEDLLQFLQ